MLFLSKNLHNSKKCSTFAPDFGKSADNELQKLPFIAISGAIVYRLGQEIFIL